MYGQSVFTSVGDQRAGPRARHHTDLLTTSAKRGSGDLIVRAVTAIMAGVVRLTFLFGFGNVLSLGLRLGVPAWAGVPGVRPQP